MQDHHRLFLTLREAGKGPHWSIVAVDAARRSWMLQGPDYRPPRPSQRFLAEWYVAGCPYRSFATLSDPLRCQGGPHRSLLNTRSMRLAALTGDDDRIDGRRSFYRLSPGDLPWLPSLAPLRVQARRNACCGARRSLGAIIPPNIAVEGHHVVSVAVYSVATRSSAHEGRSRFVKLRLGREEGYRRPPN